MLAVIVVLAVSGCGFRPAEVRVGESFDDPASKLVDALDESEQTDGATETAAPSFTNADRSAPVETPTPVDGVPWFPSIAALLEDPPAPLESVVVDVFAGNPSLYASIRRAPVLINDELGPRIATETPRPPCPFADVSGLSDLPQPMAHRLLNGWGANSDVELGDAWLLGATSPEGESRLGSYWGLPSRARIRGHLGDPDYVACPEFERIFVVDEMLADIYTPTPMPERWKRAQHSRIPIAVSYPEDWRVVQHFAGFSLVSDSWPDHPIKIRQSIAKPVTGFRGSPYRQSPASESGSGRGSLEGWRARATITPPPGTAYAHVGFEVADFHYDISMNYPIGNAYSQTLNDVFGEVVDRFAVLDAVRSSIGDGAVYSREAAERDAVYLMPGNMWFPINSELVSEAEARIRNVCALDNSDGRYGSSLEGVWMVTLRSVPQSQGIERIMLLDGSNGRLLCTSGADARPTLEHPHAPSVNTSGPPPPTISIEDILTRIPPTP